MYVIQVSTAYMQVAKAMSDYLGPEASVKVSLGLSSSATRGLHTSDVESSTFTRIYR